MFNFLKFLSGNFILLEIRFPKIFGPTFSDEKKLLAMEHFYDSLNGIKPYLVFEIAVPERGTEIGFFIAVIEKFRDIIEKQVSGFFPEAEVKAVNNFNIINSQGAVSGAVLKLKNNGGSPIQTYKKLKTGTLGFIADAISSLEKTGEGAAFQILIKPCEKNLFETNVRIISSARTEEEADNILSNLESAFVQFELPGFDAFYSFRPQGDALKKLIHNFSFRLFNKKEATWFSTEELTTVFHWPIIKLETAKIRSLEARPAPPPSVPLTSGIILGKNHFQGQETIIKLNLLDRRRHIHVMGQSDAGKKQFLLNLIKQDINGGAGVGIIDSTGELMGVILKSMPRFRRNDLVMLDAADNREQSADFSEIINNGKILFVKSDSFLGPAIIGKLGAAAAARAKKSSRLPQREFYLYINGNHGFAKNYSATILPELQKCHINVILADESAAYNNIGSLVVFRSKPEDAKSVIKHFEPVLNETDLTNIDNGHAYVKLLVGDAITTPFNIKIEE